MGFKRITAAPHHYDDPLLGNACLSFTFGATDANVDVYYVCALLNCRRWEISRKIRWEYIYKKQEREERDSQNAFSKLPWYNSLNTHLPTYFHSPAFPKTNSCSAVKLRPTHQQLVDNNTAKTFSITFRRSTGTTCHLVLPLPIPFADFITRIALLDHPSSCRASVNRRIRTVSLLPPSFAHPEKLLFLFDYFHYLSSGGYSQGWLLGEVM